MKSPVKYFGGKGTMFKRIIDQFPENGTYDTYIEPFAGSYSIGLHTPGERVAPIEIYNDLYNNVYSLFKVLSDENLFGEFKRLCDLSYYNEQMRKDFKADLKKEDLTVVERAFKFFYVNRTSHNGIGGFSVNRVVRRNMAKSVSDYLSTVDNLYELHQRMSKVMVFNRDAFDIMREYNTDNVFMYLDPPYVLSTRNSTARYNVDMANEQQKEFVDLCIESKAKLLISGYDNELYDRLLENGFTKVSFEVNTVDGNRNPKTKVETLWKNY